MFVCCVPLSQPSGRVIINAFGIYCVKCLCVVSHLWDVHVPKIKHLFIYSVAFRRKCHAVKNNVLL